ncbi:chaperone TorD involved in molybdoenzyme TorA maturation [Thermanaeromonas toyohensis ToBE]|uniref:Chaperone TorD involved in molybdoenzyme TorA maturation n=1 Tax=Thermanaeromonas toyohensis ToBE TaxID=698762 RepID=A0A1W1VYN6_9FIRM|nr:molecular chaperone TorD family protein [Thermanaeromonas toyohensis]SMB98475.1 chaperone TorD involved in molybdoenzyme TorA maturation [Thermanaeromonas toyohensis ToBE]
MDQDLLQEWFKERQIIYHLLARLYREGPTQDILQALLEEDTLAHLAQGEANEESRKGCRMMEEELKAQRENLKAYEAKLRQDYIHLFIGPGTVKAPPWESVYRSPDRLLFGEETLAVRKFYQSFGVTIKNLYREPDDHLSLELEFMAWLCAQALEGLSRGEWKRYLEGQQKFLREHLLMWVPAFTKDMENNAETAFFQGLANFTRGFLLQDLEEVQAVLDA